MNGGSCRSFLICKLFPWYGCAGIRGCLHLSSRERKAVDASAVMLTALLRWQPGAWATAMFRSGSTSPEHKKVPSWTHLGLFLVLFSWFCLPSPSVYYILIRLLWSLVLSQPPWICISPFLVKQVSSGEGAALNHHIMRRCFLPARYETTCSPIWRM